MPPLEHASEWVTPFIQLVTFAGFGMLVAYFVVWLLPSIEDRHERERSQWLEANRERDQKFDRTLRDLENALHGIREALRDARQNTE